VDFILAQAKKVTARAVEVHPCMQAFAAEQAQLQQQ
jgi:hypothetical protein